jgi:hypothetical protein
VHFFLCAVTWLTREISCSPDTADTGKPPGKFPKMFFGKFCLAHKSKEVKNTGAVL